MSEMVCQEGTEVDCVLYRERARSPYVVYTKMWVTGVEMTLSHCDSLSKMIRFEILYFSHFIHQIGSTETISILPNTRDAWIYLCHLIFPGTVGGRLQTFPLCFTEVCFYMTSCLTSEQTHLLGFPLTSSCPPLSHVLFIVFLGFCYSSVHLVFYRGLTVSIKC